MIKLLSFALGNIFEIINETVKGIDSECYIDMHRDGGNRQESKPDLYTNSTLKL